MRIREGDEEFTNLSFSILLLFAKGNNFCLHSETRFPDLVATLQLARGSYRPVQPPAGMRVRLIYPAIFNYSRAHLELVSRIHSSDIRNGDRRARKSRAIVRSLDCDLQFFSLGYPFLDSPFCVREGWKSVRSPGAHSSGLRVLSRYSRRKTSISGSLENVPPAESLALSTSFRFSLPGGCAVRTLGFQPSAAVLFQLDVRRFPAMHACMCALRAETRSSPVVPRITNAFNFVVLSLCIRSAN